MNPQAAPAAGKYTISNPRVLEGATIAGKYRLVRYLSQGNFGIVFRGEHLCFGVPLREVAIKLGKRPMGRDEARVSFADALIMSRVAESAPDAAMRDHFVRVFDADLCADDGPLSGRPYVVMELVPGGTLEDALRPGSFPRERAVRCFEQLLRALEFMHTGWRSNYGATGPILHRDLKPSNVLIERSADGRDRIKVSDFGLAIEVDTLLGWADSDGDLAYLAPESFSRNLCSPQTDVYMLGLIFHQMITGTHPFAEAGSHLRGDSEQTITLLKQTHYETRRQEKFELLRRDPEMRAPSAMLEVVLRSLSPDPADRYANAGEFRAAWNAALSSASEPPSKTEKPWDRVRRLTREAEDFRRLGKADRAFELMESAMKLNRDRNAVPDASVSGVAYLSFVELLLSRGNQPEAWKIANEGYARRRCRSTCLAMSRCLEDQNPAMSSELAREADSCPDKE